MDTSDQAADKKRKSEKPSNNGKRPYKKHKRSITAMFSGVSVIIKLRPGLLDTIDRKMTHTRQVTPDIANKLRDAMMEAHQILQTQTDTPADWLRQRILQWDKICSLPSDPEPRTFLKEIARELDFAMANLVRQNC